MRRHRLLFPRACDVILRPKLLYFVSVDWYFVSHRLPLAVAAKAAGYDVTVVTQVLQHGEAICDAGLSLVPITLARAGINPAREVQSAAELMGQYRRIAPDLVHNVAVKPVVYGTFAARTAGVKGIVNALMGLGWVFSSDSAKARSLRPLVTAALRSSLSGGYTRTIVQNADDAALLADRRLTRAENIRLIRGSGVDPKRYVTEPPPAGVPLIVLPARLLIAKGVREFMQAAALLKSEGVAARFALVGKPDSDNVASIPRRGNRARRRCGRYRILGLARGYAARSFGGDPRVPADVLWRGPAEGVARGGGQRARHRRHRRAGLPRDRAAGREWLAGAAA